MTTNPSTPHTLESVAPQESVRPMKLSLGEKLMLRTSPDPVTGCWIWAGEKDRDGYGRWRLDRKYIQAHRLMYLLKYGECPPLLDHIVCDNRGCVNPDHVEPSTNRKNTLRGVGPTAVNAKKTTCIRGHEFGEKDWKETKYGRQRRCHVCHKEANRAARAK